MNIYDMSEEDIKLKYITPAIVDKMWSLDDISMEVNVKLTDGKISLKGNFVHREKPKFADYVLYINRATPIAIVEAKDANHSISHGMQQAMTYAKMMDVPFAYSSNGMGFEEYDFLTGKERTLALNDFPTKLELYNRYRKEAHNNEGLSIDEEKIMNQPYCSGQDIFPPRYYQRNAVNRTLQAIARGDSRVLLVMATGTGKTYTAFQIVWRLLQSGLKKKVLYLADRNILVDQSIQQDFRPLEKTIHKINYATDVKRQAELSAYQVYFALYQQLIGDDESTHYKELFTPDYFDLVIVDECHRGSAKEDSRWRSILEYFKSATHIGMTATPKETKYQSNIDYFGNPIYRYSLKDGIDDGFLAPFKVISITTNIGDEWRPTKGQKDIYGNLIEDRIYNNSDYDYNIIIEDRIREVAHEISNYLKATNRMQKTIVFCASELHADLMRKALVNENSDMCKKNSDYVVRITGSDDYGKSKLDYFISVSSPYPVIATTSKLLSTGVDCKMVKLIVLDQTISSMTEFKQIIGRGTRIREKEGKTSFSVMDFRNVTRLFADPDWDGEVEQDPDYPKPIHHHPYKNDKNNDSNVKEEEADPLQPQVKPVVDRNGCKVYVINKVVSVYDNDGHLLRTESVVSYTKKNILDKYATLEHFIHQWRKAEKKTEIAEALKEYGIDLHALKHEQKMDEVDDFDFICHIAYDQKPLTRRERALQVKKRDIFNKYGDKARAVLDGLLDKYCNDGVAELENIKILQNDPFREIGAPIKIAQLFGGKAGYLNAVRELEEQIYNFG